MQRRKGNNPNTNEIINNLQPLNTTIPNRNYGQTTSESASHPPTTSYYGEGNGNWNGENWPHDLLSVSSINTPTNYAELFNQLSAPTPMNDPQSALAAIQQYTGSQASSSRSAGTSNTFSNPAPPAAGEKGKKVSDAYTYGPRFCEIFHTYCRDRNITINTKQHLFSLCIDHLIPFTVWARDTEDRVRWLSSLLFDNDYLRPEVRNGIVMVIIYTFSSIKAAHLGGDMFSQLQDTETGLGIANRFSLKIYNDPYGYLSFLKFSISSLIDAGAIPENERMNKPFKKGVSKPLPRTETEIQAYAELKSRIMPLLDTGKHNEGKSLVQVVTTHWQFRGNALRTRRFSTALELISKQSHENHTDIAANVYNERMARARDGRPNEQIFTTLADIKNNARQQERMAIQQAAGVLVPPGQQPQQSSAPTALQAPQQSNSQTQFLPQTIIPPSLGSQAPQPSVLQKRSYSTMGSEDSGSGQSNKRSMRSSETEDIGQLPPGNRNPILEPPPYGAVATYLGERENSGHLSENSSFGSQREGQTYSGSGSGNLGSGNVVGEPITPGDEIVNQQSPNSAGLPRKPFSFKALRFERIGSIEWKIKELIVFDLQKFIESLANLNISQVFLLNEFKLIRALKDTVLTVSEVTKEHEHQQRISDVFGLITLENELTKLNGVITSWQSVEIPQCQQFLTSFYHHYFDQNDSGEYINSGLSLYQFWHQFDPREYLFATERTTQLQKPGENPNVSSSTVNTGSSTASNSSDSKFPVMGCLAYEVSNSLILIIRKVPVLGVVNDIWCKIYPNDLMHAMDEVSQQQQDDDEEQKKSKPTLITFGSILIYFFPQLLLLEKRIRNMKKTTHMNTLSDVFIKYYAFSKIDISNMNNVSENREAPEPKTAIGTSQASSFGTGSSSSSSVQIATVTTNPVNLDEGFLPQVLGPSAYQTIGTFSTPARKVLARLHSGARIHDFILEVDPNDM